MLEEYFSWEIEGLSAYGFLHITFCILTIIASFLLCKIGENHTEKQVVKVVFIIGIIFLILETYKQLFYNNFGDGLREYSWGYFPFQLCSTPMYFCLFAPLFKEKFRKTIYSFLAFYGFIAGLTVMFIADTVIIDEVTISIQSLIWHGMQCVLGSYLIKTQDFGHNIKEIIPGVIWFLILVVIALLMNDIFELCKNTFNLTDSFNMFYISKYYESNVLVLGDIWKATNFGVALICYLLGVSLGASFIFLMAFIYQKYIKKSLKQKEA